MSRKSLSETGITEQQWRVLRVLAEIVEGFKATFGAQDYEALLDLLAKLDPRRADLTRSEPGDWLGISSSTKITSLILQPLALRLRRRDRQSDWPASGSGGR
jgi:hypothetical protein